MTVKDFLDKVAYKHTRIEDWSDEPIEEYLSKFDDSYITHVGLEDSVEFLADREITEQLTHGVGFSPKDNKWYGWSHRAICGFTIGSECKKGHVHYRPSNLKDMEEDAIRFWTDEYKENIHCEGIVEQHGDRYFLIKWENAGNTPNESIRGNTESYMSFIDDFGKGEWVAETMEDAKQMAIDFCKGIS